MKYLKQSGDVLNEADRYQRQLDWQMFCMEQEMMLWGPSDVEWVPGEPMFTNPWDVRRPDADDNRCEDRDCCPEQPELQGYYGNFVRPMFQTFEYEDPDLGEPTRYECTEALPKMRCQDCQVKWRGDAPCWVCGSVIPEPKPMFMEHKALEYTVHIETDEEAARSRRLMDAVTEGMAPFRFQFVETWMDYDIDFHMYRIGVHVRLYTGLTMTRIQRIHADAFALDPDMGMELLAEAIRDDFRFTPAFSVNDNIVLGEE